ncbi:bifunctional DNA primase/polymerase [Bradyrhizobium sp. USDA 4469]
MMGTALAGEFDPDFANPAEWAAMYRAYGLQVIPCYTPFEVAKGASWKRPKLSEWTEFQESLVSDAVFARWYGVAGEHAGRDNIGILTGRASGNVFVIDLDDQKGRAAGDWWCGILAIHNNGIEPETWRQHTGGGGRQILFRAPPDWQVPTNRTSIGVDIRGQGGFAVLPASMHESGRRYAWAPGCAPYEIEVATAPAWLLAAVEELVERHGGDQGGGRRERTAAPGGDYDAFGNRIDGREEEMRDVVWRAVLEWYRECPIKPPETESKAHGEAAYLVYERRVKSRLEGADKAELLEREGRGSTAFMEKWRREMAKWGNPNMVAEAAKPNPNFDQRPPEPNVDPETSEPLPLLLSAEQFVAGFTPPAYLVDGVLQRGYLYALTARTGHGKTAVTMYIAQAVDRGVPMHGREVKAGTVLLLAGENPDDIRARFLVLADVYGFKAEDLKMRFVSGVIDIAAKMAEIQAEAEKISDLVLVIVDTAAAYFPGDESNSNSQQGAYARLLRQLTFLPGKPAVLVNCHPVKNASRDNLLPMGGSAFLNEVDGNLTLWATAERQTTLHWLGKFRGPEFEPMTFELEVADSARVIDAEGRLMPSVVAKPVSEIKLQMHEGQQESEENMLMRAIAANRNSSIANLAIMCGFVGATGQPQKSKVYAMCGRLIDEKLLERRGNKYRITPKGKREIGWKDDDD